MPDFLARGPSRWYSTKSTNTAEAANWLAGRLGGRRWACNCRPRSGSSRANSDSKRSLRSPQALSRSVSRWARFGSAPTGVMLSRANSARTARVVGKLAAHLGRGARRAAPSADGPRRCATAGPAAARRAHDSFQLGTGLKRGGQQPIQPKPLRCDHVHRLRIGERRGNVRQHFVVDLGCLPSRLRCRRILSQQAVALRRDDERPGSVRVPGAD